MKALIFREIGEPNVALELIDIEEAIPASSEVLVQVLFSPVNPSDLQMIRGRYGYQPSLPASPGAEGVGVVLKVGDKLPASKQGTVSSALEPGICGARESFAKRRMSSPSQTS